MSECTCNRCCYARKHPQLGPAPHGTARSAKGPKVTHMLVGEPPFRRTLWCRERADIPDGTSTTENPQEVTCKRCIAAGGCGPGWKS